MKLLVIIVTYNGMQWIDKCLGSLKTSTIKPDVYIVDNGSTDGTQAYIQKNFPDTMFHQSKENLGFGKANNMGFRFAIDNKYDYVYLLNQDAWIKPDTLNILFKTFKKNPQYGILSPMQIQADEQHFDTNFAEMSASTKKIPTIYEDCFFGTSPDVYEVDKVMAAHWMLPIGCLKKIGGFSPVFRHYGEDINFIQRALFHGYKIGIVPQAVAIHDRGNRAITKEKRVYLAYINSIIMLSNPNNIKLRYIRISKILLKSYIKTGLLKFNYIIQLVKNHNTIVEYRRKSKFNSLEM